MRTFKGTLRKQFYKDFLKGTLIVVVFAAVFYMILRIITW